MHIQEAANLARYGELSLLIIFVLFAVVFIVMAVVIALDRISYTRLIVHSVIVWIVMVLQLYALFSVNIHRRASDQVLCTLLLHITFSILSSSAMPCLVAQPAELLRSVA